MAEETYLTTGEFSRAQQAQTTAMMRALGSIDTKLDVVVNRLTVVETQISERTVAASAAEVLVAAGDRKSARNTSVTWSAAVAGGVMLITEAIKAWAK